MHLAEAYICSMLQMQMTRVPPIVITSEFQMLVRANENSTECGIQKECEKLTDFHRRTYNYVKRPYIRKATAGTLVKRHPTILH